MNELRYAVRDSVKNGKNRMDGVAKGAKLVIVKDSNVIFFSSRNVEKNCNNSKDSKFDGYGNNDVMLVIMSGWWRRRRWWWWDDDDDDDDYSDDDE